MSEIRERWRGLCAPSPGEIIDETGISITQAYSWEDGNIYQMQGEDVAHCQFQADRGEEIDTPAPAYEPLPIVSMNPSPYMHSHSSSPETLCSQSSTPEQMDIDSEVPGTSPTVRSLLDRMEGHINADREVLNNASSLLERLGLEIGVEPTITSKRSSTASSNDSRSQGPSQRCRRAGLQSRISDGPALALESPSMEGHHHYNGVIPSYPFEEP
ncbi:hypothetical protein C8J56DRAFT_1054149 [Mycena floridula]|nr:hypothetical protein C8J56DRAFT_1054149 [Mycena floridula]